MAEEYKIRSGKITIFNLGSHFHSHIQDNLKNITAKFTRCISEKIFYKMVVSTCMAADESQEQLSQSLQLSWNRLEAMLHK